MYNQNPRRRNPAARIAPHEVIVLDDGKRLTGRLMYNAFVWTEDVLSEQEWREAIAAATRDPEITVVVRDDNTLRTGVEQPKRRL